MDPENKLATVEHPDQIRVGLGETLPEDRLISKEVKVVGGVEIARHQFINEEFYNTPPLKGHVVNLHVSEPVQVGVKLGGEA